VGALYCTGTGDDQVFYYQGKPTARSFGTIDFNIGLVRETTG
jgi:hypothetical protein